MTTTFSLHPTYAARAAEPFPTDERLPLVRYIVSCRSCSRAWAYDVRGYSTVKGMIAEQALTARTFVRFVTDGPCCEKPLLRARAVVGKFSAKHKCNAKCLSSKGPSCECSCGGKNHGASHL